MFEVGDRVTMDGLHRMVPNPARRRWQFWKPRMVALKELAVFEVTHLGRSFVSPKLHELLWPDDPRR